MIFGKVKGILTYHCRDWRSRFEKLVDNLTSNGWLHSRQFEQSQTSMCKHFWAKIYCHTSCLSCQVLILEWGIEGKGEDPCFVYWQVRLYQWDQIKDSLRMQQKKIHLLLRIISRICKESRIHLAFDTINTFDYHSIFICVNKIFV